MTKNKLAFLTVLAGALLSLPMAHAQTWSTIATSCSPGSDSIGRYAYSNGTFEFSGSNTGMISTRCQINNPLQSGVPKWNTLSMGYQDPDTTFTDYEVQVFLERVRKTTGAHQVIASVDSNQYSISGPNIGKTPFNHTFNFTDYVYYVGIRVNRNDSVANPTVWFASLN
ncbi:MAG TPA: hypothetical protein VKB49_21570 [Candidatus Sulfotelmatobacter sp.]|nr:hypothetical protein [Candidatus Sulfotelmatobacter sp.]